MQERSVYLPPLPTLPRIVDYIPGPEPRSVGTAPPTEAGPAAATPAERRSEKEKQPRLTVSGRLGSPVTYGQTPKGQPKAHFVLGVHTPTDAGVATDWKTVLTFGERVAQLRALNLAKGEAARIIGYLHTREVTKNGKTKTIEEIYATGIQRL